MEVEDLQRIQDYNEYDLLFEIIDVLKNNTNNAEETLKGNKAAAVRLRKGMQDIRFLCEVIRSKIQTRKGTSLGSKKENLVEEKLQQALEKREADEGEL